MKKSILICLVGLFMLAGTQATQAQTKEETIAWIKEKLEMYKAWGNNVVKNVKITPCSIYYEVHDPDCSRCDDANKNRFE